MSILIKGMEMPRSCDMCRALDDYGDYPRCIITEEQRGYNFPIREKRMDRCPLIELPPHGRLIAEKTITEIRYHDADGYHIVNGEQLCELEIDADTVIEAKGETDA